MKTHVMPTHKVIEVIFPNDFALFLTFIFNDAQLLCCTEIIDAFKSVADMAMALQMKTLLNF